MFTCPIWNITTKHPGTDINSYATNNLTSLLNVYGGYCQDPTQMRPGDLLPPLNPDISNCFRKINPFSQCKNNCRGGSKIDICFFNIFQFFLVNFPVVAGGAALIFASAIAPVTFNAFPVALGLLGVGTVGVGGNMLAQSMCLGPFYCRTLTGDCCLLVITNGRTQCPRSC